MDKQVLHIQDMECIHCQTRIEKALANAGIDFQVFLDTKTVIVPTERIVEAKEILDDLGFTVSDLQ